MINIYVDTPIYISCVFALTMTAKYFCCRRAAMCENIYFPSAHAGSAVGNSCNGAAGKGLSFSRLQNRGKQISVDGFLSVFRQVFK